MRAWIKGGIIGFIIWAALLLTFKISGALIDCIIPTGEFGEKIFGFACWNPIQKFVLTILSRLSFPFHFLGAGPNMSSVGPRGVMLFWVGSAISLALWGMLAAWIITKLKSRKN